jgi:hypothetical protein
MRPTSIIVGLFPATSGALVGAAAGFGGSGVLEAAGALSRGLSRPWSSLTISSVPGILFRGLAGTLILIIFILEIIRGLAVLAVLGVVKDDSDHHGLGLAQFLNRLQQRLAGRFRGAHHQHGAVDNRRNDDRIDDR